MVNSALLFALASIIAVTGIMTSFKQLFKEIQDRLSKEGELTQESIQKELTRFFIKIAIVETIPILLIVFGFIKIESKTGAFTLIEVLPAIVPIVIMIGIGILNIIMTQNETISLGQFSNLTKTTIHRVTVIGMSMMSAIPIVSFVAIINMIG